MSESAKEGTTGLPEGLDIGLGPGDRAFEPHYSDQIPLKLLISEGFSYSLSIAAQNLSRFILNLATRNNIIFI